MKTESHYFRFRNRLVAGFTLLVALLAGMLVWKIYSSYSAERTVAYTQTKSFAQAMSAHVASEMRVVDLSLIRSSEALGELNAATLKNGLRVRQVLALAASVADSDFWIHYVDLNGIGVVASNGLSIAGVSFADRTYFKASAGRCDSGLYIGAPEIGRVSKRYLFFMSRAVCSASEVPLGVVVAPVDASAIAAVFRSALFQQGLSITLLHGDGKVIARAPLFENSFAQDLRSSALYQNWTNAPSGTYEGRSMVDKQVRVFSYQTIGSFPLAVAVGAALDAWSPTMRANVVVGLGGLGIIAIVLVFSGQFTLRSFKQMERSEEKQRGLNAELRETRDNLAQVAKRARMIADSLPALVSYVNTEERYVFLNSSYRNVPGFDVDRMIGSTMREALGEKIYILIGDQVKAALNGAHVVFERSIDEGSSQRHLKYEYTPDIDENGKVLGFYTMVIDITSAKEIEARLTTLARVDALTGLPNRNHLYERLGEALARSRRGGTPTACLYLDIDHFKSINDSLGHAGGDEVLRQFGHRLRLCVRETDLVARLAGDEFVIVIEGVEQPAAAQAVAEKVVSAMGPSFVVEGTELAVSTSVGVAVSSKVGDDTEGLLKKADAALYLAKGAGRGGFKVID